MYYVYDIQFQPLSLDPKLSQDLDTLDGFRVCIRGSVEPAKQALTVATQILNVA